MLKTVLFAAAAASLAFTAPAFAQQGPPPGGGGGAPPAPVTKNPADAPAGVYHLDTGHSAVIARVAHARGVSFSTLRFAATKGVLTWDPANPSAIKLEAAVDAKPHYEPIVYRLPPESEQLLNAVKFPTITFTSTAVAKTGATKADVTGNLTLLGVTKSVVMHLEVVGVGKTMQGAPVIGFTGAMEIKRSDFGMTFAVGPAGDLITFTLDGEFVKS